MIIHFFAYPLKEFAPDTIIHPDLSLTYGLSSLCFDFVILSLQLKIASFFASKDRAGVASNSGIKRPAPTAPQPEIAAEKRRKYYQVYDKKTEQGVLP